MLPRNSEYAEGLSLMANDIKLEIDVLERCVNQAAEDGERYPSEIHKLCNELELKRGQLLFIETVLPCFEDNYKPPIKPTLDHSPEVQEILNSAEKYYREVEMPKVRAGIAQMKKELGIKSKNPITQETIDSAVRFPIDKLIEVKRNKALCPFHDDHNPSMSIKNNRYHCFVCDASGDVIDLYMHIHNCEFKEAVKALNI